MVSRRHGPHGLLACDRPATVTILSLVASKKDRTPNPPRNVQAPKRRDTKSSSHPLSEVPRWVWLASVGVLAGAAIVIGVLASGGSSSSSVGSSSAKAAMLAAGCTYRDVKPLPAKRDPTNYHADVPTLSTPTKGLWSTNPPSGGAHYGLWAVWDFYTDPVNPRQVVHNEEHGGVIIWYGPDVSQATVNKLRSFYNEQTTGVLATPYPALGSKIALTAWTGNPTDYYRKVNGSIYYGIGHIAVCPSFNEKAFVAFRDAYRGKGPEGIPLSSDTAGSGPQ
jgi:Protein of unknown function (DUF3105)